MFEVHRGVILEAQIIHVVPKNAIQEVARLLARVDGPPLWCAWLGAFGAGLLLWHGFCGDLSRKTAEGLWWLVCNLDSGAVGLLW